MDLKEHSQIDLSRVSNESVQFAAKTQINLLREDPEPREFAKVFDEFACEFYLRSTMNFAQKNDEFYLEVRCSSVCVSSVWVEMVCVSEGGVAGGKQKGFWYWGESFRPFFQQKICKFL